MIPMTYPMEGVAVDVQDHARRTGTHGGDDQFGPPWG
jgi:hypothetical protein